MSYATWTKAIDLANWPDELQARQKMPALVRRLIHATIDHPKLSRFPADEGTQRKGWDGVLEVEQGNAWVPNGASAWEIGTDKDPLGKADSEYEKRTKAPGSIDPKTSTFVFVTPRKWEGKIKWRDERRNEGHWQDVRVYDSDDLEQWLEIAPAVDAWLARLRNKLPQGAQDLSSFWDALSATSAPAFRREVFFAGRAKARKDLEQALAGSGGEVPVHALSLNEVRDFLAAVVSGEDTDQTDIAAARALIVDTRDAWRQLAATRQRLTLIAGDRLTPDRIMVAEAVAGGHQVVTQLPYTFLRDVSDIRLPRVERWELQKALEDTGFGRERAQRLARESGGCTSILIRIASQFEGQQKPAWSEPTEAAALLPLVLLGSWNDRNQHDRQLVETITGKSYADVQTLATRWINQPDAPLQFVDGIYSFVSRDDSWRLLSPLFFGDQLEAFEKLAKEILEESDPRFEMAEEERYLAHLYDKLPAVSSQLRAGVAETVALLGVRGGGTPHGASGGSSWRGAKIVRGLLHDASAARWFSLSHLLPLLAEAAPDEFLTALETDLASDAPALAVLFGDGSHSFFSSRPYVGLMWGLQHLAWDSVNLTRASLVLARLTELDPGVQSSPRPASVLHGIYRFWYPETSATVDERLDALGLISERYPEVAWPLLKALVARGNDVASPGSKPRWRDYDESEIRNVTNGDIWRQTAWAADRLVEVAAEDSAKWKALAEDFVELPDPLRDALIARFRKVEMLPPDSSERVQVWETVRDLVQKHRFYHDALWALPPAKVDELADIAARLLPADPLTKHKWLFNDSVHDAIGDAETPYADREHMIEEARLAALREIFASHGLTGVIELAGSASFPAMLGRLVVKSELVPDWQQILPERLLDLDAASRAFALGYADARLAQEGDGLLQNLPLETWAPEGAAGIGLAMPFARKTWEVLRHRNPSAEPIYWQRVSPLGSQLSGDELEEAVKAFLEHKRLGVAIDTLATAIRSANKPDWILVADALDAASLISDEELSQVNFQHYVWQMGQVMRCLQSVSQADRQRLATLEWRFLPLTRFDGFSPKSLHKELSTNPASFVEVLSDLFKPEDGPRPEDSALTPARKQLVEAAYRLLDSWREIPGTTPDGTIDADVLTNWVKEARRLSADAKRLKACDSEIGELLGYSPMGADEIWPCEAVRAVLEKTVSEELVDGFAVSAYNQRGIVTKSLTGGGEQERELSARYAVSAQKCKIKWPRTARILRRIADHYDGQAKHEDERTEETD